MVEEWRAVAEPGYEGFYEVSSLGRVRSIETRKILALGVHPKGYRSLVLSTQGRRQSVLVHRLVLMAFVGPPPEDHETRHRNGDRADNVLTNLSWGTSSENEYDKRRHGTDQAGDRNGQAKITEEQAVEIRARALSGESQRSIAKAVGLSQPQVCRIISGKRRSPRP
jgi:hypothetical protein